MAGIAAEQSDQLRGRVELTDQARPVAADERITAIDSLRGFAVLGILIMNIYAFAMPFAAYGNPLAYGGVETANLATWYVTHLFADQKFLTIFAMLFGAGIVLLSERLEGRGVAALKIFYTRQAWLLGIGLMHGYLLWLGDILFLYAVIGMLIYPLRKCATRTLLTAGVLLLCVTPVLSVGMGMYMAETKAEATRLNALVDSGVALNDEQQARIDEWHESRQFFEPTAEELAEQIKLYQQGSYLDMLGDRATLVTQMYTFGLITYGWRIAGLMLFGMALLKLGVFSAECRKPTYGWFMGLGYGLGLPLATLSALQLSVHEFSALYAWKIGGHYNYVASVLVAFGHIGLVMRVARSGLLPCLVARLAAVGRLALTNYLMHTVVMTSVFYSYGLGLFGTIPRARQMVFVAALLAFQLLISPVWLKYFRYGPVEWLWRSLTYGQWQTFRRPATQRV